MDAIPKPVGGHRHAGADLAVVRSAPSRMLRSPKRPALPRRSFPRGFPKIGRTQRLSRIDADRGTNPQIIHDVETALAAFELGYLRLIGSKRAAKSHWVTPAAFQWRWSIAMMARYSRSNSARVANVNLPAPGAPICTGAELVCRCAEGGLR